MEGVPEGIDPVKIRKIGPFNVAGTFHIYLLYGSREYESGRQCLVTRKTLYVKPFGDQFAT